jgi:hypothetical protein
LLGIVLAHIAEAAEKANAAIFLVDDAFSGEVNGNSRNEGDGHGMLSFAG